MERRRLNKNKPSTMRILGAAGVAATAAALGVSAASRSQPPESVVVNGPHREYQVKPDDNEQGILQRAYPGRNWEALRYVVDQQLPLQDRRNHMPRPGETLEFGMDAHIGKVVDPSMTSAESN